MTEKRKVQLETEVVADTSGLDAVAEKFQQIAEVGQAGGQQAAQGLDAISNAAAPAAQKLDAATGRMAQSIQRATAAMQAGAKGSADYYEALARSRGIDTAPLQAYITELRAVEQAQRATQRASQESARADAFVASLRQQAEAAGRTRSELLALQAAELGLTDKAAPYIQRLRDIEQGHNAVGMSARATSAAMRTIPAQLQDIAISLQGGMNPLTVLSQQGSQLATVFGGVGPALRGVAGYLVGLVNPFTVAAAAVAGLAVAAVKGAAEWTGYTKALALTGNQAGVTAGQLQVMARSISSVNGTQGAAAEALQEFIKAGRVGSQDLERFAATAIRFQQVTGTAVSETAKQFAELGRAPSEGALKLNESTNFLTASLYRQIKALEDQGKATEAARLAQRSYDDAVSGTTATIEKNLGTIERGWIAVKEATAKAIDAVVGIGRAVAPELQLTNQRALVAQLEAQIASRRDRGLATGDLDPLLKAARERLPILQKEVEASQQAAQASAQQAERVRATAEWDKDRVKYLSDQKKMQEEIVRIQNQGIAAGVAQSEIDQRIAKVREDFAKKNKGPAIGRDAFQTEALREYAGALDAFQRIAASAAAKSEDLSKTQEELRKVQASPTWAAYSRQQQEQIIFEASLAQAKEDSLAATKASEQAHKDFAQALATTEHASAQHTATLEESARAAERDLEQFGLLKSQIQALTLARLEDMRAAAAAGGEDVDQIDRRIAAQKRLIEATRGIESKETAKKAADETEREWKRTAESIEQSLTDALLRGFESGKSGAENFRDTLKNMFATLVLRPAIQAVMSPVSGALSGIGQGIGSAITGGGGSALGGLGSLGSLGGGLGMLGGVGSAFTAGSTSVGVMAGSLGGAGGLMGGVASALAAVPVAGWIGLAAIALYSVLSKKRGGPKAEGFFNPYNQDQYYSSNNAQTMSAAREQAQAFKAQYDAIVSAYGGTGGVQFGLGYSTDPKGDAPSQVHFGIGRNGQAIANIVNTNVGRSDEELTAAIAEQGSRAVLLGLQQSNIGGIIGNYLQNLGDVATAAADTVTEALQRVQKAGTERQALEAQLFDLTHTELERLVATRQREREALDESNRALYDHVARLADLQAAQNLARDTLLASYQTESASLQAVVERHRGYAAQLRETRDGLSLSDDSPLTATQRAALARSQFQGTLAGARAGDETALQNLGGSAGDFLEAARAAARSPVEVAAAFAKVQAGLTLAAASADSRATLAQQQLDTMTQQLTALGLINTSVVSVRDALAAYLGASAAFNQEAGAAAVGGLRQGATLVGELGREMVDFETPSRVYTAEQTAGMFATNAELLPAMRQVVQLLQASNEDRRREAAALVSPLVKMEARQGKWDHEGQPPVREEVIA